LQKEKNRTTAIIFTNRYQLQRRMHAYICFYKGKGLIVHKKQQIYMGNKHWIIQDRSSSRMQ